MKVCPVCLSYNSGVRCHYCGEEFGERLVGKDGNES